jgi:hypothetical protein
MKTLLLFLALAAELSAQTFTFNDFPFVAEGSASAGVSVTVTSKFILDVSGTAPWDVEIDNPDGDLTASSYPGAGTYTLCILTNCSEDVETLNLDGEESLETLICTDNRFSCFTFVNADNNSALTALDLRSNTNLNELYAAKLTFDEVLPLVVTNMPGRGQTVDCYDIFDTLGGSRVLNMANYSHCTYLSFVNCDINDISNIAASYDALLNLYLQDNLTIPTADADALAAAFVAGGADGGEFKIKANFGVGQGLTDAAHLVNTHGWTVEAINYPPP